MRRGRPLKPIISIESITSALKMLDYSSQVQSGSHVLETLQLIDFHLQSASRPLAEDIRAWMLRKILVDFITTALNQNRQFFDLKLIVTSQNRQNEKKALSEASQLNSSELLGWSMLYIRYVRPELAFTVQEIAEILHINERTARRYQEIAILKLRDILTEAEWKIRQEQQLSYLKSQIPHQIVEIVGRESELKAIFSHLAQEFNSPIFISGETGIGKSALCAKVAHILIDQQSVDYLIWMRQPNDIEAIKTEIWNMISPHDIQNHWREIVEHQKLLLVIEDLDSISNTAEWTDFLADLQSAYVLIANKKPCLNPLRVYNIHLQPLSRASACIFIEQIFADQLSDSQIEQILDSTFGNPRRIHEINQHFLQDVGSSDEFLKNYYDKQFNTLSFADKLIILLNTFSKNGIDKKILDYITSVKREDTSLSRKILTEKDEFVYLPDSYVHYIENRFPHDLELQSIAGRLIDYLTENVTQNLTIASVLLDILLCDFHIWDNRTVQDVLETIDVNSMMIGDAHRWRNLYLRHFGLEDEENPEIVALNYKHAIALRRLHHISCEQYLINLIKTLGNRGDFNLQVKAYFELAIFYHHSAWFEQSMEIYNHILQSLLQYANPELIKSIQLQHARIAITRQDTDAALEALQDFDLDEAEVFVLFCEAQLLKGEYGFIIETVVRYMKDKTLTYKIRARLYTMLARTYQATNIYDKAIIHFNAALSVTEQHMGIGDIARARNNLASAYLMTIQQQSSSALDEIEDLLIENQRLQRQVKDLVGLEASMRNLRYLQSYRLKAN